MVYNRVKGISGLALIVFFICTMSVSFSIAAEIKQKVFATPEDAAKQLIEACKTNDREALLAIFGAESKDIVVTSDEALEKENRMRFYNWSQDFLSIENSENGKKIIVIGILKYPFPIPLVKSDSSWFFDTQAGREEILNRRIGENEHKTINACRVYVNAQNEYAKKDRNNNGVIEYAQKLKSSEGKEDGLYWKEDAGKGEERSPLGPLVADAGDYGANRKEGDPFYGYYYRILTCQGKDAPGGAYNYIINGNMVAGFALIAYPAEYGSSGVMTFIINSNGKLYQKDLGNNTPETAEKIKEYNPDNTWDIVKE